MNKESILNLIKYWLNLDYIETIFDSEKDNWNEKSSELNGKINEKNHLIFLFTNTKNKQFGFYIENYIDTNENETNSIEDENCFLFILENEKSKRFFLKDEKDAKKIFTIYDKNDKKLCQLGKDLIIMKKNDKNKCKNNQELFNYENNEEYNNIFEKKNEFEIKSFEIIQMGETENMTKNIQEKKKNYLNQIELWTEMKIKEKLFDSEENFWLMNESEFDEKIFGKENIIIMIEDFENNVFGCYVQSKFINIELMIERKKNGKEIIFLILNHLFFHQNQIEDLNNQ